MAVVVAGLLIAHIGPKAMSERTRQHLDPFWELIDEMMNVVLLLLIGLEVLIIRSSARVCLAGLAAVVLVLLPRFLSVGGGLSLAMALSLGPEVAGRQVIVAMTYFVVVFSIAVQGLTFGRLLRRSAASRRVAIRPRSRTAAPSANMVAAVESSTMRTMATSFIETLPDPVAQRNRPAQGMPVPEVLPCGPEVK